MNGETGDGKSGCRSINNVAEESISLGINFPAVSGREVSVRLSVLSQPHQDSGKGMHHQAAGDIFSEAPLLLPNAQPGQPALKSAPILQSGVNQDQDRRRGRTTVSQEERERERDRRKEIL